MLLLKQTHLSTLTILLILSIGLQEQAQTMTTDNNANEKSETIMFNAPEPPTTGQPGHRSDAGSRSCGAGESFSIANTTTANAVTLLALVPTQKIANSTVVYGKTASEHPTFWFYAPYSPSSTAIFVLQDRDGNLIHETSVLLSQTTNIINLTLPMTVPSLEAGQPYHWFLKLYCDANSSPSSFVDGWIQYEPLLPEQAQQIQTANLQQQAQIYAADGFWFDALAIAAKLRDTQSDASAWVNLLDAIGLEAIADETGW